MPISSRSPSQPPSLRPTGSGSLASNEQPQRVSNKPTVHLEQASSGFDVQRTTQPIGSRISSNLSTSVVLPKAAKASDASLQFVPRKATKRKFEEEQSDSSSSKKLKDKQSAGSRDASPPLTTERGKVFTSKEITAKNTFWPTDSVQDHIRRK